MNAHDQDLQLRYQQLDYVAAFSKYWAILNHWFVRETGVPKDRDAVQRLKVAARWTAAIDAARPALDITLDRNGDSDADYYRFTEGGILGAFVEAFWNCPAARARLNLFTATTNQVRATATILQTTAEYRSAYSRSKEGLATENFIVLGYQRMERILAHRNVEHVGPVFYRHDRSNPSSPPPIEQAYFDECWQRIDQQPELQTLANLSRSAVRDGLASDILEMLYVVRNGCVHGEWDFLLNADQNRCARDALIVLEHVLAHLRDNAPA